MRIWYSRALRRTLADPKKALGSKDAMERMFTASMLIHGYRTPRAVYAGEPRTEPIEADLSKLILETLAAADWNTPSAAVGPYGSFIRLGLTDKDGWTQPNDFKEFVPAARKWLREHADSYRIRRVRPRRESAAEGVTPSPLADGKRKASGLRRVLRAAGEPPPPATSERR
jgi:hypothetical protein